MFPKGHWYGALWVKLFLQISRSCWTLKLIAGWEGNYFFVLFGKFCLWCLLRYLENCLTLHWAFVILAFSISGLGWSQPSETCLEIESLCIFLTLWSAICDNVLGLVFEYAMSVLWGGGGGGVGGETRSKWGWWVVLSADLRSSDLLLYLGAWGSIWSSSNISQRFFFCFSISCISCLVESSSVLLSIIRRRDGFSWFPWTISG